MAVSRSDLPERDLNFPDPEARMFTESETGRNSDKTNVSRLGARRRQNPGLAQSLCNPSSPAPIGYTRRPFGAHGQPRVVRFDSHRPALRPPSLCTERRRWRTSDFAVLRSSTLTHAPPRAHCICDLVPGKPSATHRSMAFASPPNRRSSKSKICGDTYTVAVVESLW